MSRSFPTSSAHLVSLPLMGRPSGSSLRLGLALAVVALVLAVAPAGAAEPQTLATYQGWAVDAAGQPLAGRHEVTLRYLDVEGTQLLTEAFTAIEISGGRFAVQPGTGRVVAATSHETVASVFAEHPQLDLEVTIDGVAHEPLVGVLPASHSLKSRLVAAGLRSDDDDDPHWKGYQSPNGKTAFQSGVLTPAGTARQEPDSEGTVRRRPYTLPVIGPSLSPAVRDLPLAEARPMLSDSREVNPPRHESLFDKDGNRFGTTAPKVEDHLAGLLGTASLTPTPNFEFAGVGNVTGVLPPDTEGTVGLNHYVQVVNSAFAVYDKSGSGTPLTGPSNTNTLWAGFGGPCQTDNSGDAILAYDEAADRFVLTQFAVAGSHQSVCFAISQTPDPTGSYYLYEVVTPRFPDYYKLGVWPDANNNAYFFGTNSGFQGQYDVFAVDRANMLAGAAARPMQFFQNFVNLMMPADPDGHAAGAPTGQQPRGSSTPSVTAASPISATRPATASTSGSSTSTGTRLQTRPSVSQPPSRRPRGWPTSTGRCVASLFPIAFRSRGRRRVSTAPPGGRCSVSSTGTSVPMKLSSAVGPSMSTRPAIARLHAGSSCATSDRAGRCTSRVLTRRTRSTASCPASRWTVRAT